MNEPASGALPTSMGLAPRQSPFETGSGKPEAPEPRRVLAYGDPDDPCRVKRASLRRTRRLMLRLQWRSGLFSSLGLASVCPIEDAAGQDGVYRRAYM